MRTERVEHLQRFYSILGNLEQKIGGRRTLAGSSGRLPWPKRGIYFFRELGENRTDSGSGLRIVRVGTHALKPGSGTKLWTRLSQHRGQVRMGGGNHRGSIFRLIVGAALIAQRGYHFPTWGEGNTAAAEIRAREKPLEYEVSRVIGEMPFAWLAVEDEPGADSARGDIERNAISLLSNYNKPSLDPSSPEWLGHYCDRERVRKSGLWNSNHVDESYDPAFLDRLEHLVSELEPVA